MLNWLTEIQGATVAAIFSAIATALAAYAAWAGPQNAARLAEEMRKESEANTEKRRLKHHVFNILMSSRATYFSTDAVNAFNLIDVVFLEQRKVRDAWADFISSLDDANRVPDHMKKDYFRKLLAAMSEDLGLASELRADDFNRVYYPNALAEVDRMNFLLRQKTIRDLSGGTSPSANTAVQMTTTEFPPPPTSNPV